MIYFMTDACIGPKAAQKNVPNPSNLRERGSESVMSKNQSGDLG